MDLAQDFEPQLSHLEPPPEIHSPGTPTFLPTLLSYIRYSANANVNTSAHSHASSLNGSPFPLDPAVLQSILLCLIAGKHLILRVGDEDIPHVVKLAVLTLSSVFAYHPVHRLRIRPKATSDAPTLAASSTNPDAFLRSVFLPSTRRNTDHLSSSSNNATPIRRVDSSIHSPLRHSHSGSAYTSQDEASLSTIHAEKTSRHHRHRSKSSSRSHHTSSMQFMRASYSSDLALLGTNNTEGGAHTSPFSVYQGRDFSPPPQSPPPSVRQISFVSTSTSHRITSPPHAPPTDPTPYPSHRTESTQPSENPIVPGAIILSGLEHASGLSQRALVRVLSENRLVLDGGEIDGPLDHENGPEGLDGVWNLPDNFIMVYVCSNDPHERPGIHHSLLDKFAMSTTITLQPATRNAVRAYRSHSSGNHGQSFRSSPSLGSMPLPIIAPRPTYPGTHAPAGFQSSHGRNPSPSLNRAPLTPLIPRPASTPFMIETEPPPGLLPETLLPMLRSMYASTTQLQISPHLLLYAADLITAVRHHPQLEGALLTVRTHTDVLDLSRATRLLGIDLTGMEIIQMRLEEENAVGIHGSHRFGSGTVDGTTTEYGEGMSEVYSGISSGMGLLSPFGDAASRPSYDRPSFLTESAVSLHEASAQPDSELLDVSEADIARIVPRVTSHRVRVRDGPEDEVLAGMVFGAVAAKADRQGPRSTVKDIMISILAEV